jgi:hypothetical protein
LVDLLDHVPKNRDGYVKIVFLSAGLIGCLRIVGGEMYGFVGKFWREVGQVSVGIETGSVRGRDLFLL